MQCSVCSKTHFKEVFSQKKLKIFSALSDVPFSESSRFDALLYRCIHCGFVQQKISPALERFLTDFYTKEESFFSAPPAEDEDAPIARVQSNIDFIRAHCGTLPKSVLEIGAYDGYFLNAVRKAFKIKKVVGIEILKKKNRFPDIRMIHSPYPSDAVKGETFDLIIILNVLEHVFNPRIFMTALHENLSASGSVLIEVPNEKWAFETGMISYQHQHISYFTPVTIRRFLGSVGLKIDALYIKDHDRMLLLCSKTKKPVVSSKAVDLTSRGYDKRIQSLLRRYRKLVGAGKDVGLYGASTFTHNMLQIAGVNASQRLFDGDERKAGKYMSDVKKPVSSWRDIDQSGLKKILIMPLGFTKEIKSFLKAQKLKTPIETLF